METTLFVLVLLATVAWWQWQFGPGYIIRRVRRWRAFSKSGPAPGENSN